MKFQNPDFIKHDCVLLEGVVVPAREVDNFDAILGDRRSYMGNHALMMVERTLGI